MLQNFLNIKLENYFMKKIIFLLLLTSIQSFSYAESPNFKIKQLKDFKTLATYKSVEDFDKSIAKYTNACMNKWGGSAAGSRCLIGYNLWDRELNIYYKKLRSSLKKKEKNTLKSSQKAWLKSRDLSRKFVGNWVSKEHKGSGTMFISIRASDADYALTSIVRQRALTLQRWFKLMNNKRGKEPKSMWYRY